MSLTRAVTAGTLVGVVTAFGIFVTSGPDNLGAAASPAAPTFAPVPTPTVTQLADCEKPAVLDKGICVTTKAGPAVTSAPASTGSRTTAPRTAPAPAPAPAASTDQEDQEDEHGDDERDDDERED